MPVLSQSATYSDYVPLFTNADKRIDAAITFLKNRGTSRIILAAHSCGAYMAMHWLTTQGSKQIAAFIGMGMGVTDQSRKMSGTFPFDKINVPVLDIYGEKEFPQVIETAPERQALMKKGGNPASKQMVLPEANHFFTNKGDELTAVVGNWLNSLPF